MIINVIFIAFQIKTIKLKKLVSFDTSFFI
jgi:hypothetical protein